MKFITKQNKFVYFLIIFLCQISVSIVSAQNEVSSLIGIITDEKKEPIPGATVKIIGTNSETVTDTDGKFLIKTRSKFPLSVEFRSIGFDIRTLEVLNAQANLAIELKTQNVLVNEVVVSASKIEESI